MTDDRVEVMRVEGRGSSVMVQAAVGSVGITTHAREGQSIFGGTFWLAREEAIQLAEAIHLMADRSAGSESDVSASETAVTGSEPRIANLRAALAAIVENCLGYGCDDIARQALWADEQAER